MNQRSEHLHAAEPGGPRPEAPPLPPVRFDPALLADPALPPAMEGAGTDGLRQHLRHYSGQLSPRHAITRLDDPLWRDAWDTALAALAGKRLVFRGSELGVFALRALGHGAAHALCVEAFPLDARIATGNVQKHFLGPWHARHGAALQGWPETERRASFEDFAKGIDVMLAPGAGAAADTGQASQAACDGWIFPHLDHSLLGTGIVGALRQFCGVHGVTPATILPAKASVYAMGIEWAYPGAQLDLAPLSARRWSMYPQALDDECGAWIARTAPVRAGEIDFATFAETTWDLSLPTSEGSVHAIVYWFELDLGTATISNAPGSALGCIKPAVQYVDALDVRSGGTLRLRAHVQPGRLYFETLPPAARERLHALPHGSASALWPGGAHGAWQAAVAAAVAARPGQLVLDIGAGCGLTAALAARAGAAGVVGCERHPGLLEAGRAILEHNGLADKVTLLDKDCRGLNVPEDLPRRADLAIVECFDASLIGDGLLHFLAHARTHLTAQGARLLPASARIRGMLVEYRIDRVWDIDASLLNPYRASPGFVRVDASTLAYRALSEPFDVFAFDFATAGPEPQQRELRLRSTAPGMAGAVLFWFDLQLEPSGAWASNAPGAPAPLDWQQALQCLPEVRIGSGEDIALAARHDGSQLVFGWLPETLDKEAMSKVPRLDPRWLAASHQLEQQTQGLLQHCARHPEEYARVAGIAQRFAVDPAAHGLDPVIAQRFASMFFDPT